MHAVYLPSSYGMSTDSMTWPSIRRYALLIVPSLLLCSVANDRQLSPENCGRR